jgi:RecA-family ATPase
MYPYAAKKEPFPPPPSPGGLELVHFENMKPRLGDGYLIKGLLGSGAMAVLYGESGSGKTFLALHLGLCVAGEIEVFGHRVRQCGVVYIAAEAGRGIENRVAVAKQEFEFPEMMPFAAIETPVDLCTQAADTDAIADAIRNADLGMPVELIIIDTLSRVMAGGNENAPDDMGALVRNLDRLRADTGGGILIVHHTGKELSRGARGHSLLRAATDTEIETTKDEAIYTARVTKQRDYATEGSFAFSLHQVELGFDRDGDQITSCIVEPSDSAAKADKPGKRLSDDTRIALRTLRKAISEAGEPASPRPG